MIIKEINYAKILFDFQVIIVKSMNCVNGDEDTEPAHANVANSTPPSASS